MIPTDAPLPRTRGECPPRPVPCRFVVCRHHLWFDRLVENGRVIHIRKTRLNGNESRTCSLRFAEQGPLTLEQVGRILGVNRERVRQMEAAGLARLRENDEGDLRDLLDACFELATDRSNGIDDRPSDDTGVPEFPDAPDDTGDSDWANRTGRATRSSTSSRPTAGTSGPRASRRRRNAAKRRGVSTGNGRASAFASRQTRPRWSRASGAASRCRCSPARGSNAGSAVAPAPARSMAGGPVWDLAGGRRGTRVTTAPLSR